MANLEHMKLSLDLLKRVRDELRPFSLAFWQKNLRWLNSGDIASGYVDWGDDLECGTVCCFGGYMMNDADHQDLGLNPLHGQPLYEYGGIPYVGFEAIAKFWDVEIDVAKRLCSEERYRSGRHTDIHSVIRRMDACIYKFTVDLPA